MPVNAEEVPGLHTRLPIVRQVLEWMYQSEKKSPCVDGNSKSSSRLVLIEEEEPHSEFNMAAAAAAAAAALTVTNAAASVAKSVVPRCPYSAVAKNPVPYVFQMPLHYPRYTKEDYQRMPEWQLDRLFEEYGLSASGMGSLQDKREYAIGAFIWRD